MMRHWIGAALAAVMGSAHAGLPPTPGLDGSQGGGLLAAAPQLHRGEGTVKAVDAREGRVKLAHEPIGSLGWGAMNMFFEVERPELLTGIEVGSEVQFEFYRDETGRFVITGIGQRQ